MLKSVNICAEGMSTKIRGEDDSVPTLHPLVAHFAFQAICEDFFRHFYGSLTDASVPVLDPISYQSIFQVQECDYQHQDLEIFYTDSYHGKK